MKIYQPLIISVFLTFTIVMPVNACRFWCAIGENIPRKFVEDQLIHEEKSLKNLGSEYQDGWSVAFYNGGAPMIKRGANAADEDPLFTQSVREAGLMGSHIYMGHLRRASSGCVEGVPNPHPFTWTAAGKTWTFGHNGGMKKQILIDLIGQEYLASHHPEICDHAPPESWIDSELYFIYLLKMIEQYPDDVMMALQLGLKNLYDVIPEENRYLNFFLSDGERLWTFRKGNDLYYLDDLNNQVVLSSSKPEEVNTWKEFPENHLAELKKDGTINFQRLDILSVANSMD